MPVLAAIHRHKLRWPCASNCMHDICSYPSHICAVSPGSSLLAEKFFRIHFSNSDERKFRIRLRACTSWQGPVLSAYYVRSPVSLSVLSYSIYRSHLVVVNPLIFRPLYETLNKYTHYLKFVITKFTFHWFKNRNYSHCSIDSRWSSLDYPFSLDFMALPT